MIQNVLNLIDVLDSSQVCGGEEGPLTISREDHARVVAARRAVFEDLRVIYETLRSRA
jgi:hypothetical protein